MAVAGDHLGGVAGRFDCCIEVLGTPFSIGTDSIDAAALVTCFFAAFAVGEAPAVPESRRYAIVAPRAGGPVGLYQDGVRVFVHDSAAQVLGVLVGEINLAALDAYRGLAVHAGVVARGSHAVAFPGASGAGKSTLAAACLLAGFDYVSDEALCIDYASSAVVPYAKPLKLSAAALRLIGAPAEIVAGGRDEVEVVASQLSAVASAAPLHLAEVVRLSRSPGPPRLERLPSAQVVTSLLQFSFNHFKQPGQAFELSTRLAHSCRAWDLVYADPGDAARLLWDSLRESPGR